MKQGGEYISISLRKNFLRTLEFRSPEWIPMLVDFAPAVWKKYREDLEELVLRHPMVFAGHEKGRIDSDEFGFSFGKKRILH